MKDLFVKFRAFMHVGDRWAKFTACLILGLLFGFHTGVIAGVIFEYEAWKYTGRKVGISPFYKEGGVDWWALLISLIASFLAGVMHFILF